MSFLAKRTKASGLKKKSSMRVEDRGGTGKRRRKALQEDELDSSGSEIDSDEAVGGKTGLSSDEEELETPQEKKLRLTKQYLADLKKEEAEKQVVDEVAHEAISHRLQQDELAQAGKLHKVVSDQYTCPDPAAIRGLRGHGHVVTCAVISPDGKTAFSASRDGCIIKWSLETYKKLKVLPGGRKGTKHIGHTASVLSIAISSDGKFLATGDKVNLINIWETGTLELLKTFRGHRQGVTGLAFRMNSHQLFSASYDRSVKIWDLDEMAYVETLFGHEHGITAVDSLIRDRAVTVGMDRHVHLYKVPEESTLRFNGNANFESVALVNESTFITGSDDNCLSLWSVLKKKPVFTCRKAHGDDPQNCITAVASLRFTDLIASGSKDGFIRFWKCVDNFRTLTLLFEVALPGFVNSLQFSSQGDFLLAGLAKEHRLGSWWSMKEAKNTVFVIPLPKITAKL